MLNKRLLSHFSNFVHASMVVLSCDSPGFISHEFYTKKSNRRTIVVVVVYSDAVYAVYDYIALNDVWTLIYTDRLKLNVFKVTNLKINLIGTRTFFAGTTLKTIILHLSIRRKINTFEKRLWERDKVFLKIVYIDFC